MNVSSPKWFTAYKPPVINYGPRTIFCINNLKFKKSYTVILPKSNRDLFYAHFRNWCNILDTVPLTI